jgi:F0F1-type ATP synthase epsilon subunit
MISCTITSPKKTTVYKKVQSIILPALSGQMQILPGHAESFILLREGNISLRQLNKENEIIQNINGECHIKDNEVVIIL